MSEYHVVWEIDIDAETPRQAAQKAFDYINLPGTSATIFDVFDEAGEPCRVDLLENEEPPDSLTACADQGIPVTDQALAELGPVGASIEAAGHDPNHAGWCEVPTCPKYCPF